MNNRPRARTVPLSGISRAEDLLQRAAADPVSLPAVGILGPGGSRKSALLRSLADTLTAAGTTVVDARQLGSVEGDPGAVAGATIVADDAHLMEPAALQRLTELVETGRTGALVAFRPWPRPPALTTLAARLRSRGPLTVLQHLTRGEVTRRAEALRGGPVRAELVDVLVEQTCGLPLLLDEVMAGLCDTDFFSTDLFAEVPGALPAAAGLPDGVVDRLAFVTDDLEPPTRLLMHAVAAGAGVDTAVLAALLGQDRAHTRQWIEQSRATGYLLGDGRLIPVFRRVLLHAEPIDRTTELQLDLVEIQAELGHDALPTARLLGRGGTRSARVAAILAGAARRQLHSDPATAAALFGEAVHAGADARELTVEHAAATALSGNLDLALQLADRMLTDSRPDRAAHATEVAATVLARQGQLPRAAELYSWLGADRVGAAAPLAALTLLAVGRPDDAAEMLAARVDRSGPTMLPCVSSMLADGVRLSVTGSTSEALTVLTRAASMLEALGPSVLLPDTPAALAALISIEAGEFEFADSTLRRAVSGNAGGRRARVRHLLLLGWIAMVRGRLADARTLAGDAVLAGDGLDPRDEFLLSALRVGISRRTGDRAELAASWQAARQVVARQDVDLFMVTALAELVLGAHRSGQTQWVADQLARSWALVDGFGAGSLWSTSLHWACAMTAVAAGHFEQVRTHATALRTAGLAAAYPAVLADALHSWSNLDDLERRGDAVHRSAAGLRSVGLSWEAAGLLSAAAAHCTDRRMAAGFLQSARAACDTAELRDGVVTDVTTGPGRLGRSRAEVGHDPVAGQALIGARARVDNSCPLTGRELEIAHLLLVNLTYRQIGEKLFLSPKTVEHQVARIKQRLGVAGRSELFAALRRVTGADDARHRGAG